MTTALIKVLNESGAVTLYLYRYHDGHPRALGVDLAEFCDGYKLIRSTSNPKVQTMKNKYANGMGCFAAQLVCHLKVKVGYVDIVPAGSDSDDDDYVYEISNDASGLLLECRTAGKVVLMKSTPRAFKKFSRMF